MLYYMVCWTEKGIKSIVLYFLFCIFFVSARLFLYNKRGEESPGDGGGVFERQTFPKLDNQDPMCSSLGRWTTMHHIRYLRK